MKLVRLNKICVNETYGKIQIGICVSHKFPFQNGLKEAMLYHHCFLTKLLKCRMCASRSVQENQKELKLDRKYKF